VKAAESHPHLSFVLDHLGKPPIASGTLDPWATAVRSLAALPNTACKVSGMVTEADPASWTVDDLRPYADTVLNAFGSDRLMFGSDWPVCTLAASYEQVARAAGELVKDLTDGERTAVFETTAVRVYGL
jgi:L-fuconolactonase